MSSVLDPAQFAQCFLDLTWNLFNGYVLGHSTDLPFKMLNSIAATLIGLLPLGSAAFDNNRFDNQ